MFDNSIIHVSDSLFKTFVNDFCKFEVNICMIR